MTEIKIVPYEDKENHCTELFLINSAKENEEIKMDILINASRNTNFAGMKKLMSILDTVDIEELKQQIIAIIIGKAYALFY